nr:hypothetical protein [Aliamphritea spongicola]
MAEKVFAGREEEAAQLLQANLDAADPHQQVGEVYLVGGGPGDPELLTLRLCV